MTSDNVKAGIYITVALVAGYFGYTVYKKFVKTGQSIGDLTNAVTETVTGTVKTLRNSIADSTGIIERDNSSNSNPDYVAPEYVVELPFKKWPQSTKNAINALNLQRGITRKWYNEGDFSGWHVYSNGAAVSPDGFYLSDVIARDNISASETDFQVLEIPDNFSGMTFDQTKYQWQNQ